MNRPVLSEIEQQALQLSPDEQLVLLEKLAHSIRSGYLRKAPRKMYGAWRGHFPESLDVDRALREIRGE